MKESKSSAFKAVHEKAMAEFQQYGVISTPTAMELASIANTTIELLEQENERASNIAEDLRMERSWLLNPEPGY